MSRPQNYFTELSGIPVHYARPPVAPYATRGRSYRFYCLEAFEQKLAACFEELWQVCPYGQAEVITSAGAYVNKAGYHGLGRGFDLDAIFWPDKDFITLDYPSNPVFYLGIEAIIRRHFGTVLGYLYNRAHHDHFHIDDGSSVAFSRTSKSRVLFLQSALTHVFAEPVLIDGIYGNQTSTATYKILNDIGLSGDLEDDALWSQFLLSISESAFGQALPELSPPEILRNLYTTIDTELADSESRKRIETVLNVFVDHEQTQEWLGTFE